MEVKVKLEQGKFYHIYNKGVDSCDISRETANYEHFLRLYDKYIIPIASTFAWVLMKNHFHLLVRIDTPTDLTNLEGLNNVNPHQQFFNFFNAYTKAFNKRYQRKGTLFEHSFKRKEVNNENYLKTVLLYIHNNPVHHGFYQQLWDFPRAVI